MKRKMVWLKLFFSKIQNTNKDATSTVEAPYSASVLVKYSNDPIRPLASLHTQASNASDDNFAATK